MSTSLLTARRAGLFAQIALLLASGIAAGCASRPAKLSELKPVEYRNVTKRGPAVIVVPGEMKTTNIEFSASVSPDNIADFAELELLKANFTVFERKALAAALAEIQEAYAVGDANLARQTLQRGGLESTKWVLKFDVLKAEPVAQTRRSFSGATVGKLAGYLLEGAGAVAQLVPYAHGFGAQAVDGGKALVTYSAGIAGGVGAKVTETVGSSISGSSESSVWVVGMRYKLIDATSGHQVGTGYAEHKMETSGVSSSGLATSSEETHRNGVDSIVQRLVQLHVQEIDEKYK